VDCKIEDVLFYLDYVFPKTKVAVDDKEKVLDAKITAVLAVLDKIHDTHEGEDLSGHDLVEERIEGIY